MDLVVLFDLIAMSVAAAVLFHHAEALALGPVQIISCSYIAAFCFVAVARGMDDSISSATAIAVRGYRSYFFQIANITLNFSFVVRLCITGEGICPQNFFSFGGAFLEVLLHFCFILQGCVSGGTAVQIRIRELTEFLERFLYISMKKFHGIFAAAGWFLTGFFNICWLYSCNSKERLNPNNLVYPTAPMAVLIISPLSFLTFLLFASIQEVISARIAGERGRFCFRDFLTFNRVTHNQIGRGWNRFSLLLEMFSFFAPLVLRYYLWCLY